MAAINTIIITIDEYKTLKMRDKQFAEALEHVDKIFQNKDKILTDEDWWCPAGADKFEECVKLAKQYKIVKAERDSFLKHFAHILAEPLRK